MTAKTNDVQRLLAVTLAFVLVAGIASPVFADIPTKSGPKDTSGVERYDIVGTNTIPDHAEIGDAGDTPATAQNPSGVGGYDSVSGTISDDNDVDMWEICLDDPSLFSAETTTSGENNFLDTFLWLFDSNGIFVDANDDIIFAVDLDSFIGAQPGEPAGTYYVAVGSFENFPLDEDDNFAFVGKPVVDWDDDGNSNGAYVIDFTGTSGCIPVGGELMQIDNTALIVAGAQTNAVWILSALVIIGSVAFGALYITSKKN